jgi:predicted CoA-binding protein
MNVKDEEIPQLLKRYKKLVVIGLSPDGDKPSHSVPLMVRERGWDVVGTYPKPHRMNGFQIYPSLKDVPAEYRKFVDVFRSSDRIPQVVDEVLAVGGVEVLFLQLGIEHSEAEARAEKAGIRVISNRCLAIEHRKMARSV